MDPLLAAQAEIASLGPLQRVQAIMLKQEAEENRQAEAARYERIARAEAVQMATYQRQRIERYQQGHTSEELAAENARREEIREAKIEEHLRELRRLDPARFGDGVRRARGPVQDTGRPPAMLARDREFMLDQVRRYSERRENTERLRRQQAIARLERQASSGGTITRPGGYVTGMY
jgi:hypothetical protein